MAKTASSAGGRAVEKAEADVTALLARRTTLDRELGTALSAFCHRRSTAPFRASSDCCARPGECGREDAQAGCHVHLCTQQVTAVVRRSWLYSLHLSPGMNGLVWYVRPTKEVWAFQVDLIANGQALLLDRHSSGDVPKPKSVLEQQPLDAR
jgi:hypothetical protein